MKRFIWTIFLFSLFAEGFSFAADKTADIDFLSMDETNRESVISEIISSPQVYTGKTVRIAGAAIEETDLSGNLHYGIAIYEHCGCCPLGIFEYFPASSNTPPRDGASIILNGKIAIPLEKAKSNFVFKDASTNVRGGNEPKDNVVKNAKVPAGVNKADVASLMVAIPGKDIKIGKFEVTQSLWEAVMGDNPSYFKGADRPVESVSRNDCLDFIKRLNEITGEKYRLPTAEEWEYACRAGSTGKYGLLADGTEGKIDDMGWYRDNSGNETHPVGQKKPNAFGLYDMHGNVCEWVTVPDSWDENRTFRGGSYLGFAHYCKFNSNGKGQPGYKFSDLGLRLAVSIER